MKKIFLSIIFILSCAMIFAQERTVALNGGNVLDLSTTRTVVYSTSLTADRLIPTTRDTIDFNLTIDQTAGGPLHFYAVVTFDTVAGVDTSVTVAALCKQMSNQDYTAFTSVTSAVISAEIKTPITSIGVIASEIAISDTTKIMNHAAPALKSLYYTNVQENPLLYYRYFKLRLIIKGNDSVGTGIKVKRVEINFF